MIVPDVNLLLYAHFREFAHHDEARRWWVQLVSGREPVGVPWLVSIGFVRLATHPTKLTMPLSTPQAVAVVERWLSYQHISVLLPGTDHLRVLAELLRAAGQGGNVVPDAHIAAVAIEHDAEIHTNDRGFARFPGLRWSNPLLAAT
ncbi:MAG: type II toxin-antitoxin system VapC family toxin [Chloroflexota bacterium]|nr:type II toxin-antitoxin system VapC family toxin [Chloroflexota bacterium]MDE2894509.1 type II toxin-antitoxin system VapC family toxin [Chloroflexota bacterium]